MKKFLIGIGVILLIFIILIYASLFTKPDDFVNSEVVDMDNVDDVDFSEYDSVLVKASTLYKGNEFKKMMQGEHYRKAWSTPIKVPVIYLDTFHGGLKIVKEGGGKQTKSLKLEDSTKTLYAMRSINKDPDDLIPEFAKTLRLDNIVVDGISAQHPYAAIVVAALAEKAEVLQTHPKIAFIPKQKTLGDYNDDYGDKLYLLEYETESKTNWTHFDHVVEIIDTKDLQELKLEKGKHLKIDVHALVRARLFDLLIGDWDRHAKQWGWVIQKKSDDYLAIPLPCDRDNAFFNAGGVIPTIISNENVTPELRPFKEEIDYLPGLVQRFDIYFLHDTPQSVFVEEAKHLQELLTDEAIESALREWPKQFYDLDAKDIKSKIIHRRDNLILYAKGFQEILSQKLLLDEALKGSENEGFHAGLTRCFECAD